MNVKSVSGEHQKDVFGNLFHQIFFIQKLTIYSNFVTYERGPYNCGLNFIFILGLDFLFADSLDF